MKGYKKFLLVFSTLFILYVIAELNKPTPIDWSITLSKNDKNPYGGYIVFRNLKAIFPTATILSYNKPLYDQLNNTREKNSGYLILSPTFSPSKNDFEEMLGYVNQGNFVFIAAANFGKSFLDSFKIKMGTRVSLINKDSTSVNFVNPALKTANNYTFLSRTIDEFFTSFDTAKTIILGMNDRRQANFIKYEFGEGAFFIHSAPICFSNYFMLIGNNADYTAKALSYMPGGVNLVRWDEKYKPGNEGPGTPLRFFLNNNYLLWALRLALAGLLIYVFFEVKRRQRVIPVITPLRNNTLDFTKTVSNVYFNQRDNDGIADKKITYFLEFIRNRFYLQTTLLEDNFVEHLARKSGINSQQVSALIQIVNEAKKGEVNDRLLMELDRSIDEFYKLI